jgi:hypothetical protein
VVKDDRGLVSGKPHGLPVNRLPLKSIYRFLMSKEIPKSCNISLNNYIFVIFPKQPILVELILNISSSAVKELSKRCIS